METLAIKADGWEYAGHLDVDSGTIMMGDPCYSFSRFKDMDGWHDYCNLMTYDGDGINKVWGDGVAITVFSGFGDGSYPVYVKRNPEGRVMQVYIEFGDETETFW